MSAPHIEGGIAIREHIRTIRRSTPSLNYFECCSRQNQHAGISFFARSGRNRPDAVAGQVGPFHLCYLSPALTRQEKDADDCAVHSKVVGQLPERLDFVVCQLSLS